MSTLKLLNFSGEIPKLIPRSLPEMAAQRAENVRLDNGGLTPYRQTRLEYTVTGLPAGGIQTIYKNGSEWLAWATHVNAAPGPVAQDRLYFTGDGVPKMRVAGVNYNLKLAAPTAALTATPTGSGSGDITTRLYAYTFVTDFGEESEPCALSNSVNWQTGITITLTGFQAAPAGRNITKQRIYRSQTGVAAGTSLFFIAERAVGTGSYVDNVAVNGFDEVIPSLTWNTPPDTLSGLIPLANGMMCGFVGKDLYFCEPYHPHAWPEEYVLTMDYDIVALGAYGSTVVVATEGTPYIVTGSAPENMVQEKLELNLPCINARGMIDLGYAVAYPSHDGLVVVANGSANVVTDELMTRRDWLLTSPSTYVTGQFSGRYFASYRYTDALGTVNSGTFIIDLTGSMPFILRVSYQAEAFFYDIPTGKLFMLVGTEIYEFDDATKPSDVMTWRSKQFVLPAPTTFGALLVEASDGMTAEEEAAEDAALAALVAANQALFTSGMLGATINGELMNTYALNGDALAGPLPGNFSVINVYADRFLVASVGVVNEVVRLPAVGRARMWEVEVSGNRSVTQISMATTVRELNAI